MLYQVGQLLNESGASGILDTKSTYTFINQAAREVVSRALCLGAQQTISTVINQTGYDLNADFLKLYLRNKSKEFFIKYNDGSADSFIKWGDYENIIYQNNTDSVPVPSLFSIIDSPTLSASISGTNTLNGPLTNNESVLTDGSADFTNVSAGDIIHNVTDGSDGVVLQKTSTTVLATALFGGTLNKWSISDSYTIQPQGRLQLVLNPPPSNGSNTITVFYQQRPAPVYADLRTFRFNTQYFPPLVSYAAFLYKYKDRQPNFGDHLFVMFDKQVKEIASNVNFAFNRTSFGVNFKKRK